MKYLSLDLEATGLEEGCHLIQLAFVPLDTKQGKTFANLGKEWLIQCPSYAELEPKLNEWVKEHNRELINQAHAQGMPPAGLRATVEGYLKSPEVHAFFDGKRPVLLGKSMSALDVPMLKRYLGWSFMEDLFHHHTVDLTCVARFLVDSGHLPPGCESTTKLIQHFKLRDNANHTALSDAVDMAEIYIKLVSSFAKPVAGGVPLTGK